MHPRHQTSTIKSIMVPTGRKFRADWMTYAEGDYVTLYASKLAGCAGMHPYVPQEDLRQGFLRAVGLNLGYMTREEAASAQLEELEPARKKEVLDAMAGTYATVSEVHQAVTVATAELAPEVASVVRSAIYTKRGHEQEASVREEAAKRMRQEIRTSARFRTSREPICTVDGLEVYVGGKHDGIAPEAGEVVEIKTRQRRFLGAPRYEVVQVHAYMHIYGLKRARIVESYAGETREHVVAFDDALWAEVRDRVSVFVRSLLEAAAARKVESSHAPMNP